MDQQFLKVSNSQQQQQHNSKSLPPSPVLSTREQFSLTSRSQHSSPCIVSQQQAKDLLNSFHLKSKINIINQQHQDQELIKIKDESIVEVNNNTNNKNNSNSNVNNNITAATPNSLKIINKVIERNKQSLSPLIISEGNPISQNNPINQNNNNISGNNQSFDIEMSTINTLTESNDNINNNNNNDIISNNGADINSSNNSNNSNNNTNGEDQLSVEQRIREERLNVLRFRIQNETLFKNYTKLNTAYGLVGMLTVFSTVFLFVKGFEKNPDNHILYVGIALSTLGFIVINHSIHIAYRRSRRNIDTLQQEFMRVYENNEATNANVDPSTIPSKLEKCTIDILSSPNYEKPPTTPRMNGFSPIFNKINTSPIFNMIASSPIFKTNNNNNNNSSNNSNNNSNNSSPKINKINENDQQNNENDNNIINNNYNNFGEVINQDLNSSLTHVITNQIDINIIN